VSPILIAIVVLAVVYAFLNGKNDSSSIVATMISSRALSPRTALGLTAAAEFLGPFIFGIAVAKTIGHGIVRPEVISTSVILAAMISAVAWNLLTGYLGLPSSSSHALIGGLIGAVIMGAGWKAIEIAGLEKTLIPLFAAPLVGFAIGYIVLRIIMRLSWEASPSINENFKRNQIFTVIVLGLSHGSNDAPKAMGVITLALITEKYINNFIVPTWAILLCAFAIAAGTAFGGERLIRTVGGKFYKITPMDALSTQLASAIVVMIASMTGGPVSASQVINTAVMGVGAAERPNKVRWKIAQDIGTAWLLTIPASALIAALVYKLLTRSIQ
jgi:inorganic phosphate transporter, PiT family